MMLSDIWSVWMRIDDRIGVVGRIMIRVVLMIKISNGSLCSGEDDFEVEDVELSLLFADGGVVCLHADDLGLAVLLHPLHDHAHSANLALPGYQLYLLIIGQLLLYELDCLVDAHVVDSLEFAFFSDGGHLLDTF